MVHFIEKIKTKPLTQVTNVKELLWNDAAKTQLHQVAAAHMKPERMMRLMANAIRTTPKLGECDPMSLLGGLMTCAGLGLEPNTIMGHAYLIPFKNNRKNITEVCDGLDNNCNGTADEGNPGGGAACQSGRQAPASGPH